VTLHINACGTYELCGGEAQFGTLATYGTGNTAFIQTGGRARFTTRLALGSWPTSNCEYRLLGGILEAQDTTVGNTGTGYFLQMAGSNSVNDRLRIGVESGSYGTFALEGGTLVAHRTYILRGRIMQSGGSAAHEYLLDVGVNTGTHGTYEISGGQLTAETFRVGRVDSRGRGGPGTFSVTSSDTHIAVSGTLHLGSLATFSAVPGAAIHMTGAAFENESTDEDALAGLGNLQLIFEGGPADTDPFEVAGKDQGPVWDGFVKNFTLGRMTLGGTDVGKVQLVDNSDNSNRGGPAGAAEAQYVKRLDVGPGCVLDLNGLNLYCLSSAIDPSAMILTGGGSLTKVAAIEAVSATVLATTFLPAGGLHGLGTLSLNDVADIVVETDDGQQTTHAGGVFSFEASLFSDLSDDGVAAGLFQGGTIAIEDALGADLLTADLVDLTLKEIQGQNLLAGSGRFAITGGSLQSGFPYTVGEVVQITFGIAPSGLADFASAFTGVSDITLTPEPATLALLAMGGLGLAMRQKWR